MLIQGSGVGVQLRGAVPIGESGQIVTYSAYAVNGPSSGASNSIADAGALDLAAMSAIRPIGWFYPWKPHYDFEPSLPPTLTDSSPKSAKFSPKSGEPIRLRWVRLYL
jgi:hypothetical protein